MDRLITISTAPSRKSKDWQSRQVKWSEFCEMLRQPNRTKETYEEFMKMSKADQDQLKDVGGFVGGEVDGQRLAKAVKGHDLITLDMDTIPAGLTDEILETINDLEIAAVVYSTRKHCSRAPRLRVIIPLNRTVDNDEYEPIARMVASRIGMAYCDQTTFDINRLMYWPNCSSDSEYVYRVFDYDFVSATGVLGLYKDWHDVREWPVVPGAEENAVRRAMTQQQDPLAKEGPIGAFCRVYSITEAMDQLIPGAYLPTDQDDRFTYAEGSTTGGAVIYEGKWLYSHHATDPCSGKLVNAWDMVRLHKFGQLDKEAKRELPADETKHPSYKKMMELTVADQKVMVRMHSEKHQKALDLFGISNGRPETSADDPSQEVPADPFRLEVNNPVTEDQFAWMASLELDGLGNIKKTIDNARVILENDPATKGKLGWDELFSGPVALGPLPWDPSEGMRIWTDTDDHGAHAYLEHYGITARIVDEASDLVMKQHVVNKVREYLESLKWDGVPRIDTLLIDYLGAADNIYTREVMRKTLAAAVMRGVKGGGKFDNMLILTGPQGKGKSTFIAKLAGDWFSDSLVTFDGKEAMELIQGTWINEVAELQAFNKSEVAAIKQFLSKQDDYFRPAYARKAVNHPRRCIMIGSSNSSDYLKDATGNRRFWPVDIWVTEPELSIWHDLDIDRDQIWAEAVQVWKDGESLFLTGEAAEIAFNAQDSHREVDGREGRIMAFAAMDVPENWSVMDLNARRFWLSKEGHDGEKLVPRDRICAAEIWCEALGGNLKELKKSDSRDINQILERIPGFQKSDKAVWFGPFYGAQRGYVKA